MVTGPGNTELLARMMPPCLPAERMRDAIESALGVALRLAGIIHMEDPEYAGDVINELTVDQLLVLPFVLASMVDVDKTPGELLGWVPGYQAPKRLARVTAVAPASVLLGETKTRQHDAECGTHKGYLRHRKEGGGQVDCVECGIAEAAWRRTEKPKRRRQEAAGQAELPLGLPSKPAPAVVAKITPKPKPKRNVLEPAA